MTAATATTPSLCVEVLALQPSEEQGQAATWAVGAWATGGNVPAATLRLQVSPAGSGTPAFSFGCGSDDGSASCSLGTVNPASAEQQFQAQVTVPGTAVSGTVVSLTVTGSAAGLRLDPAASASVGVLASSTPIGVASQTTVPPGIAAPTPTLSPGQSPSGLFPTVTPGAGTGGGTRQVADASAQPGSSPIGAEVAGLAALLMAVFLAVTRVSVRRPASPAAKAARPSGPPEDPGITP